MKLAIVAGGRGTRLGLKEIPKPMVKIGGKPILEHQINLAKSYGIKDVYILSGYQADVIKSYFGDGSTLDINITHITEKYPLGTAGAVKQLKDRINERFIVFYGDIILNIDLASFIAFDKQSSSIATIVVHPNDHPYDSDLVKITEENIVVAFNPKPHDRNKFYCNLVNAAIYILSPEIFKYIPEDKPADFGKDIFPLLVKSGETVRAYKTAEYIKDVGTIDRLKKVDNDFLNGTIERISKKYKRPAIFIDRDGTLIEEVDLLHKVDDLRLFPFSASAVKKINNSDFLSFLITNQPAVARNLCDISTVKDIHNKLDTLLGKKGAYLNDIYFCPHHPDKGYIEENKEFKIECDCRKPKTGMIGKAAEDYNIDLESSWIIGDTTTDIQTGVNAGLKTILVRTGKGGKDGKFKCYPDFIFDDLESAVDFILKDKRSYGVCIKEITYKITEFKNQAPLIICIAGLARSGKSTFVKLLLQTLQGKDITAQVLSLDSWLIGINERKDNMTIRQRYKYDEICRDIIKLIKHEEISKKIYDPYSRSIINGGRLTLNSSGCLIIDGVPALDIKDLREMSNYKIYIEVDEDIRKKRFFNFYRWKDLHDEEIECLYQKRLIDEVPFIEESKQYADIVVRI